MLPPTLKMTEETRIHMPLIHSPQAQRPQSPISFQDHQTLRSLANPWTNRHQKGTDLQRFTLNRRSVMTAAYLNDEVIVKEAQQRLQTSLPIHWEGNWYNAMDAWMTLIGAAALGTSMAAVCREGQQAPSGNTLYATSSASRAGTTASSKPRLVLRHTLQRHVGPKRSTVHVARFVPGGY